MIIFEGHVRHTNVRGLVLIYYHRVLSEKKGVIRSYFKVDLGKLCMTTMCAVFFLVHSFYHFL